MLSLYEVIYVCAFRDDHLVLDTQCKFLILVKTVSPAFGIP